MTTDTITEPVEKLSKIVRKPRSKNVIVVGEWKDSTFTATERQPEGMTDLNAARAWVLKNMKPGRYEFIRRAPGCVRLSEQTLIKATVEG